jgi:hypothetical protein
MLSITRACTRERSAPAIGAAIKLALFPLALPALALVVAPLALVAVVGLLVASILVLPLWLARIVVRSRSHRTIPARESAAMTGVAPSCGAYDRAMGGDRCHDGAIAG